ncbi:hypothetical protein [Streptacidiphilus jiangxiensis]|uniref:Secreted protein n=1 Tax=Streptacidiphilus jiangxiensis TaxID=235985 RepID=A0A1H7VZ12_STRJI|nr:hypothetical protein [Streptacidiphilus jiangxiensis]SEM14572.1 hypothetical protein SAMN05414137_119109 [Streptacidiphilus jiangxiensis]
MRHLAYAVVAAVTLVGGAVAAPGAQRDLLPQQSVYLQAVAGDDSADGVADLVVTRENGGYRLHGYVESVKGCVELKAVNMHLGTYFGGDSIAKVCGTNVQSDVDAWTHHTDIVLTAIVPHGMDWDSRIVTLTGRP